MLFVMDRNDAVCMWMKNTLIPLSVAFIDKDGFIINIEKMKPLTLDIHCSKAKAVYALEMNESWFEKNHPGTRYPDFLFRPRQTKSRNKPFVCPGRGSA